MITFSDLEERRTFLAVVGLGYVGLPLAVALSRHFDVVGFDISARRIEELKKGHDSTREVSSKALSSAQMVLTDEPTALKRCGFIIVAVPTPIDANRRPDLRPVEGASITVGKNLSSGSVVVYESTVYPGLTEENCVPLLEEHSKLTCGQDFFVGYSPERINPGDKVHTLEHIVKVVAGQNEAVRELLAQVYGTIIKAGVHLASSIKVAEAAKVIENTQRDLNIALMNELSLIFNRLGIDTLEVLEAAGTKWNFLPFRPGLVGGHCIGVDPYYLTFKAESLGFHPQVILAGRHINDSMGQYVASMAVKAMIKKNCQVKGARVGILGLTFKENVPDLRNTKVVDIIHELEEYGIEVLVHDPMAHAEEAVEEYGIELKPLRAFTNLSCLILAVPHATYAKMPIKDLLATCSRPEEMVFFDLKGLFPRTEVEALGATYWRL